jgi:glycosyltransferase involved in cell wall biosynthesis/SAM-dependent methyltransferase
MQPSETSKIRSYIWPWVKEGDGLDVGCGPDKVHPECAGLDVKGGPGVTQGNAERLPYKNDQFDWVYSAHCLEHLDYPENAIEEMIRVLKPDGTLILYLPYKYWYDAVVNATWHKHQFLPSDVLAMVKKHWPDMWIVTDELRGERWKNHEQEYSFLLILKRKTPPDPKHFFVKNFPQLGDTYSLDSLIRVLRDKYTGCTVHLEHDKFGIFTDEFDVETTPEIGGTCWDGILCQRTAAQYHDYLRRDRHFYAYPIWAAISMGWLEEPDIPDDPRPGPLVFTGEEEAWANENTPEAPFVVLAHHAGWFPRDWYDDRWERVVSWIVDQGYPVVAVGTRSPGFKMDGFTDLTGKSTLRQAACLASRALCGVGVDTGMVHVVPMFNVPFLVLSGPSRFDMTFSPPAQAIYRNDAGCQQCYGAVKEDWFSEGQAPPIHSKCDCKHPKCMEAITVNKVIEALAKMLNVEEKYSGLLSVCMIVHNEEPQLTKALESVHEYADEIIVVDTGSTDKTKEIAASFEKVKLSDFDAGTPIDSFSAARNHAFSLATCKYAMWLDGSNVASNMDVVRKALKDGNCDMVRLFTKSGGSQHRRDRICLTRFAKFVDRVHERLSADGLRPLILDAPITRTWAKKVGREDSIERNIRLLKRMIVEEGPEHPGYSRWVYYLARELKHCGKIEEALARYRERMTLEGFWEERAQSANWVVRILKDQGKLQEAVQACYDSLKLCDGWRDPYYLLGDCYFRLKNYRRAIGWLKHTLMVREPKTVLWKWEAVYQYLPQLLLSNCAEALGNIRSALSWAGQELKAAPPSQHFRINNRITELKKKLPKG